MSIWGHVSCGRDARRGPCQYAVPAAAMPTPDGRLEPNFIPFSSNARITSDHVPQHAQHHRLTYLQAGHPQGHRRRRRPVRDRFPGRDEGGHRFPDRQAVSADRRRGARCAAAGLHRGRARAVHRRRLRRAVVRQAHHAPEAARRRLHPRTVQRPDLRVQGRCAADPPPFHGAHDAGGRRHRREDHDPDRHLRRHRQGRAGRIRRRARHRDHRLLPAGQGEPGSGAADEPART